MIKKIYIYIDENVKYETEKMFNFELLNQSNIVGKIDVSSSKNEFIIGNTITVITPKGEKISIKKDHIVSFKEVICFKTIEEGRNVKEVKIFVFTNNVELITTESIAEETEREDYDYDYLISIDSLYFKKG